MMPPTPSIEIDDQEPFPDSPDRTINDLVSTSTSAGPTVQLVERMSAAVRRLESEKAGFKDEISRLSSQRDSARDEVVTLMREVEEKRGTESKVGELGGELETLKGRYEASLEMLGEREEEVEELRADVKELKRLYRELVEEKMGGR
jgi:chromosome segregation ATPase